MVHASDDLDDLFGQVPVSSTALADLHARMSAPARRYHDLSHIALLWRRHRHLGQGSGVTSAPWHRLLACAVAFHDAVYDAARQDNEARSADLWRGAAPALDATEIEWVARTILATADHLNAAPEPGLAPEAWSARLWMLDLDLTPIGEAPEIFATNTAALRAEYAHLDDETWEAGRIAFLRGLAARPVIYRSARIAAAFDGPARANLARELARAAK